MAHVLESGNVEDILDAWRVRLVQRGTLAAERLGLATDSERFRDHFDQLPKAVIDGIHHDVILRALQLEGFTGNPTSKLVKKAMDDLSNAIVAFLARPDLAANTNALKLRVLRWRNRFDPLKRRHTNR